MTKLLYRGVVPSFQGKSRPLFLCIREMIALLEDRRKQHYCDPLVAEMVRL